MPKDVLGAVKTCVYYLVGDNGEAEHFAEHIDFAHNEEESGMDYWEALEAEARKGLTGHIYESAVIVSDWLKSQGHE